jgi:hypothetical protein
MEFFDAKTGTENPPFRSLETGTETRRNSNSARSGGFRATNLDEFDPYNWMVRKGPNCQLPSQSCRTSLWRRCQERKFWMQRRERKIRHSVY